MRSQTAARLSLLSALLAATPAVARQPPRGKSAHLRATATMPVATWYSFDDDAARTARAWSGRASAIALPQDTARSITVFSKHRDLREETWRDDLRAGVPAYEASNSASAGSAYTSYPQWDNPGEMHLMSTIKDSLGACIPPLTCPGLN